MILGDLTIKGTSKVRLRSPNPCNWRLNRGAPRPGPRFQQNAVRGLPEDVIERLDVVFYGDIDRAVLKTLEI